MYNTLLIFKKIQNKRKMANAKMELGLFSFKIRKTKIQDKDVLTFFFLLIMDLSFASSIPSIPAYNASISKHYFYHYFSHYFNHF